MSPELDAAINISLEAGKIALDYFDKPNLDIRIKKDNSPVSIADLKIEEYLVSALTQYFPQDQIVGEESGEHNFNNNNNNNNNNNIWYLALLIFLKFGCRH